MAVYLGQNKVKMLGGISVIENSDGSTSTQVRLQEKTVTPEETQKTVTADGGYTGLSKVIVNAISKTFVGSNITRLAATTYIPKTSDQTIASGTYLTETQTIKGDSNLKPENIKSGVSIFGVNGTFVGNSGSGSGGINPAYTQTEKTWIPGTINQTIPAETYCTGIQTIAGDEDLIPSNIKSGVTIFDIAGTYTGPEGNVVPTTTLEAKTWTPTTSVQTIAAGTYCEGTQTIEAIPSNYVEPSATLGTTIYTPNTSDQTIALGTYLTGTQTIKGDVNLVASNIKSGTTIFNVAGTYSGPEGNVVPLATQTEKTWTPGTTNQTIASETYLTGIQTILGDANLKSDNIKSGATIFGVTGNYAGSGGATVYAVETTPSSNSTTINFTVSKQPTIFSVMAIEAVSVSSTRYVTSVDYDGNTIRSQSAYGSTTSTRKVYYNDGAITQSYSNGTLTLTSNSTSTAGSFASGITYRLLYITDEVSSGGSSGGVTLPSLSNEATAAELLSGKQLINSSNTVVTGTMTNRGAVTGSITNSNPTYTIPAGYHNGSGKVSVSSNTLLASNIKQGVNILGVTGTYEGSGSGISVVLGASTSIQVATASSFGNTNLSVTFSANEPTPTLSSDGTSITLNLSGTSTLEDITESTDFSVLQGKYISKSGTYGTTASYYYIPNGSTFTVGTSTYNQKTLTCDKAQKVTMSLS